MKIFALLLCCLLVLLCFTSPMEGRLFLTNRSGIFCVWAAKRSCSKTTPVCVQIAATSTCKYYRNECQYSFDTCLGKTVYGQTGVVDATGALCAGIVPLGGIGAC